MSALRHSSLPGHQVSSLASHQTTMSILPLLFSITVTVTTALALATGNTSSIGINYGQVADNLPPPPSVLPLLHSLNINRVKLYDADPRVLRAFASTDIQFTIGLPDRCLPAIARDPSAALAWVKTNIQPFLPKTKITTITVGNEVLTGTDKILIQSLLPAMNAIHLALTSLNQTIAVTTPHSLAVLASSYPPSTSTFRRDLIPIISPLLSFLSKTGSPFLINAYPYFAFKADPKTVALDYVLFEPNGGVVDAGSGLKYENMLHAQVDAVRSAIAAASPAAAVEVVVSETGWPSAGDEDEAGATPENARRYNGNLMRMVAEGRGTPMKPGAALGVYVFALFNENLKPGPASERHYGLFDPDGSPAYRIGAGGNATAAGGDDGGDAESPSQPLGASSSTNYYTISAATGPESLWMAAMVAMLASWPLL